MLIMSVRYLCNYKGKRKTDATFIIFSDNDLHVTEEMQLAMLQNQGVDAIEILKSKPKADVLGMSFDEIKK